jgi:UTP--glucose-1-phosphate uridylyltransferase
VNGVVFDGGRYDVGDKIDYLRTILDLGAEREDIRPGLLDVVRAFAAREGLLVEDPE